MALIAMVSSPLMRRRLRCRRDGVVTLVVMASLPMPMRRCLAVVDDDGDGAKGDDDDNGATGDDEDDDPDDATDDEVDDDDGDGTMDDDIDDDCDGATGNGGDDDDDDHDDATGNDEALLRVALQKIECPKQMLWLAVLGVQAPLH